MKGRDWPSRPFVVTVQMTTDGAALRRRGKLQELLELHWQKLRQLRERRRHLDWLLGHVRSQRLFWHFWSLRDAL